MIGIRRSPVLLAGILTCLAVLANPAQAAQPPATPARATPATNPPPATAMKDKVTKTDEEWKKSLTPEQYRILRKKGTERAFTGAYWNHHETGTYRCAGCGLELFSSTNKFDSGCGWPSYDQPLRQDRVSTAPDHSLMMNRTEVLCARCGGHLGHVFDDGPPQTTGLRYCINSAAIHFEKAPAPAKLKE